LPNTGGALQYNYDWSEILVNGAVIAAGASTATGTAIDGASITKDQVLSGAKFWGASTGGVGFNATEWFMRENKLPVLLGFGGQNDIGSQTGKLPERISEPNAFLAKISAVLNGFLANSESILDANRLPIAAAVEAIQLYDVLESYEKEWLADHVVKGDITYATALDSLLRGAIAAAHHQNERLGVIVSGNQDALPWNVKLVAGGYASADPDFAAFDEILGTADTLYSLYDLKLARVEVGATGAFIEDANWAVPENENVQVQIANALKDGTTEWSFWHQHESEEPVALDSSRLANASTTLVFTTTNFSLFGVSYTEVGANIVGDDENDVPVIEDVPEVPEAVADPNSLADTGITPGLVWLLVMLALTAGAGTILVVKLRHTPNEFVV
jgi:hypothetical protein